METAREVDVFLFLFIGMLTLFLLAGGVVLFFFIYQKRMLSQQLRLSEMGAAHRAELLHSNIEQVEAERKRIAADLHDEVGSIFSTLKLKINQLERGEGAEKLLADSREIIDAGISSVRRISHTITPPGLDMFGLADALENLCDKVGGPQLRVDFSCPDDFPRLGAKVELGLYRILQELLNNTLRHAAATEIKVMLTRSTEAVTMTYADNGRGFDPAVLQKRPGLGWMNIEARASQLQARLEWATAPGEGLTTIIVISG